MADKELATILVQTFYEAWGLGVTTARSGVETILSERQPDADTLSLAIYRLSLKLGGSAWDQAQPALNGFLQRQLTVEHVAAQELMSAAAESLSAASLKVAQESHKTARLSFWLTLASVILGIGSLVAAVLIAQASNV